MWHNLWRVYCRVDPIHERINFCIDTSLFACCWSKTCDSPKISSFHSIEFEPVIALFESIGAFFANKRATRVTLTGISMLFACFSLWISGAECSLWKYIILNPNQTLDILDWTYLNRHWDILACKQKQTLLELKKLEDGWEVRLDLVVLQFCPSQRYDSTQLRIVVV